MKIKIIELNPVIWKDSNISFGAMGLYLCLTEVLINEIPQEDLGLIPLSKILDFCEKDTPEDILAYLDELKTHEYIEKYL